MTHKENNSDTRKMVLRLNVTKHKQFREKIRNESGINKATFSNWLSGRTDLSETKLITVKNFLP